MLSTTDRILTYLLTPLSWIYGGVMSIRSKLFENGVLKRAEFDVPVISVGNITVGGTGKTPHVEYLVNSLLGSYNIGVLSRGYKRRTKGFVAANSKSTPESIGDEPYQIYEKFRGRIDMAVCESRKTGIEKMLQENPDINLIILDDAFQHLWVKPKISVLLMDYSRPIYEDHVLPLGRLRESTSALNRADFVVCTKCPPDLKPIDKRIVDKHLDLMSYQKLFFSEYTYDALEPVFADKAPYSASLGALTHDDSVLLLTGIAHPRDFVRHFSSYPCHAKVSHFPDHHFFTRKDLEQVSKTFEQMKGVRKLIITTEKDAVRLASNPYFPTELKPYVFYLPIRVRMLESESGDSDFMSAIRSAIQDPGI